MGLAGVRGDVDKVSHSLRLFSDTLEEWLECQRKWLYLENIFMAPDIQRQLPNETKMFAGVDRQFKSILRITRDRPAALQVSKLQATVVHCVLPISVYVQAANALEHIAYMPCKLFTQVPCKTRLTSLIFTKTALLMPCSRQILQGLREMLF